MENGTRIENIFPVWKWGYSSQRVVSLLEGFRGNFCIEFWGDLSTDWRWSEAKLSVFSGISDAIFGSALTRSLWNSSFWIKNLLLNKKSHLREIKNNRGICRHDEIFHGLTRCILVKFPTPSRFSDWSRFHGRWVSRIRRLLLFVGCLGGLCW